MAKEPVKASIPGYDDAGSVAESEGGEGWHPDLPRVKMDALRGREIMIQEVEFRQSTYDETKQYVLFKFVPTDTAVQGEFEEERVDVDPGEEATTSCGGGKLVDQLRRTNERGALPIVTVPDKEKTKRGYMQWVLKPRNS